MAGLLWAADIPARRLTAGDQRMLMIAMAASSNPKVLLLDEPSAGMSRRYVDLLLDMLGRLLVSGVSLLLVEHNLRLVGSIARSVTVLDAGRVIAEGSPDEISRSREVREIYLGSSIL